MQVRLFNVIAIVVLLLGGVTGAMADNCWDYNKLVSVGASSVHGGFDVRDLFGASFGTTEPGNFIFGDFSGSPHTDVVEWETSAPLVLTHYELNASNVTPDIRWFNSAKLFNKPTGASNWVELDAFSMGDGPIYYSGVVRSRDISGALLSKDFKMEFYTTSSYGVRVNELTANCTPTPLPGTMVLLASGLGALVILRPRFF